ncbi:MAG: helix-hairpin-helix domain-containing protein, partial [bacterium]
IDKRDEPQKEEQSEPDQDTEDETASIPEEELPELTELPGVGPSRVEDLNEAGFESVRDVLDASAEDLTEVKGIGDASAESMLDGAGEIMDDLEPIEESSEQEDPEESGDSSEISEPGELTEEVSGFLNGTTAIVLSGNGFVNTSKIVTEFAEEHENLVIKGGLLEGDVLEPDAVESISELPTKRELLQNVAGALNSPIQNLATYLQYPIQQLTNVLNQVKEQKQEE